LFRQLFRNTKKTWWKPKEFFLFMNFEKDPQLNPNFVCVYIDDQWARRQTFVKKNKIELQPIFQRSLLQTNHIFCSSMIVLNFWPWTHPFIKQLQFASVQFPRFQTLLTFFFVLLSARTPTSTRSRRTRPPSGSRSFRRGCAGLSTSGPSSLRPFWLTEISDTKDPKRVSMNTDSWY
jgi:hypothetical protein